MGAQDPPRNRQPQPVAKPASAGRMIDPMHRLRAVGRQEIRTEPRPVIGNLDIERTVFNEGFDFTLGAFPIGEFDGVGQQVNHHLFQTIKVPKNLRFAVFQLYG